MRVRCMSISRLEAPAGLPDPPARIYRNLASAEYDRLHFFFGPHPTFFTSACNMFQRDPRAGAFLGGDRVSGQDVRDQNGTSTVSRARGIPSHQGLYSVGSPDHRERGEKLSWSYGIGQNAGR